jgi:transposase InsO family protein
MRGQLSAADAAPEAASSVVNFGFSRTQKTTKGHHLMSTTEKLIKARMGMLALAEQLNNVSAACRRAGISRSHYYEIKEAFEKFGAEGLAPRQRRRPQMPNQTPPELETQILEMTERYPTYSYLRISDQLKLVGVGVSPSTVRAVRQRHGLTLRIHRLLWLEQKTAAQGGILTERQIRLLQKHRGRTTDPEQHVEAPYPGYLLCQDTYFIGTIKGIGKIYLQSVVDAHCSLGFGKVYLSKVPMTAVDVLNDRVLPFYEEHSVEVEHVLTDNGREYCGRELKHHFELFLTISQIAHRRTEVRSPQTNGFCERFHRTIQEEFFSTTFRNTLYESVSQLQADLDRYLDFYNRERAHRGYRTQGRTPLQAFLEGLNLRPHREAA